MKTRHSITKNITTAVISEYERQEFKYFVPNKLIDILIPELLTYLEYDHFSQNGFYSIYTTYFDTRDWQAFDAKMAGVQHRQKFRIRSYFPNPTPSEKVFLEIKAKSDNTVYKVRTPISMNQIKKLQHGEKPPVKNVLYEEWRYAILRNNIRPCLLNSYDRLAFESEQYPGLRVTLDRNVGYCLTDEVNFTLSPHAVMWSNEMSILEIKFDRYVPRFIVEMLRRYNITLEPISKYCYSVMSNYLLI